MTGTLHRQVLIRLYTALGTWTRFEFGVHYCQTCDALYDGPHRPRGPFPAPRHFASNLDDLQVIAGSVALRDIDQAACEQGRRSGAPAQATRSSMRRARPWRRW